MEAKTKWKVLLISKIAYGFGRMLDVISADVRQYFLMIFLYRRVRNQYGGCVSTYAFFKIWDAINDPIGGSTDKNKIEMGTVPVHGC